MGITVNKNSSIRVDESKTIYFDPWDVESEKDADVVFVTHDHFDHYDAKTIKRIIKEDSKVVIPVSILEIVKKDFDEAILYPVEADKEYEVNGIKFATVRGYNNAPTQFHPIEKGYLGYVVELDGLSYYVTSDSDNTEDARKVKCDVLLVPIGGKYTMDVDAGVDLVLTINPKLAIPTHYGGVAGSKEDGETFKRKIHEVNKDIEVKILL